MIFDKIEGFNKEIIGINRPNPSMLDQTESDWLIGALREEIDEFIAAQALVDKVDALTDLIYFAVGGLIRMGLSAEQAREVFCVVHEANMNKTKGKKEGREVEFELDAKKPIDWTPPEKRIEEIIYGRSRAKGENDH